MLLKLQYNLMSAPHLLLDLLLQFNGLIMGSPLNILGMFENLLEMAHLFLM